MATAAQRALGVPELVEAILVDVDIKTLLFAQRVCASRRQIIQESKLLQQALFFEPSSTGTVEIHAPVYRGWFTSIYTSRVWSDAVWQDSNNNKRSGQIRGNPLTRDKIVKFGKLWALDADGSWIKHGETREPWRYPEASLRKMLVCDPPAKHVYILRTKSHERYCEEMISVMARGIGVTIGDVYDQLEDDRFGCGDITIRLIVGDKFRQWKWADRDEGEKSLAVNGPFERFLEFFQQ